MTFSGGNRPVPVLVRPGEESLDEPVPDTGHHPDQDVLRKLRELLRTARGFLPSPDGEGVAWRAASTATGALGYAGCVVAVRGDDGNFRFCASYPEGPSGQCAKKALRPDAHSSLCERAVPVEGALWADGAQVQQWLAEDDGVLPLWYDGTGASEHPPVFLAPMTAKDGANFGFIAVLCPVGTGVPASAEAFLLEALAEITALGWELEQANAHERRSAMMAEAERRQLQDLISASLEVRGEAGLDAVLADIARSMVGAVGFARAAIYLLTTSGDGPQVEVGTGFSPACDDELVECRMSLAATVGLTPAEAERLQSFTSLAQFAPLMRPEMRVSRSYLFDHRHFQLPATVHDQLVAAVPADDWVDGMWHAEDSLTVPLTDRQGYLLGLISMDEPLDRNLPTEEDCRALEFFSDQCALAVVESRRLQAAVQDATTDPLTDLPNRRAFLEKAPQLVAAARARGSTCSALYIDIDRFKDINDSFGHATGDEVIAAVGQAIAQRLRRGDLVARYGGEEFVVLLPETPLDEAAALAETVRRLVPLSQLPEVNPPLEVHVSVGVAGLRPGDDTQALLAAADAALYQAKHMGRNRVCVAPA